MIQHVQMTEPKTIETLMKIMKQMNVTFFLKNTLLMNITTNDAKINPIVAFIKSLFKYVI